VEEIVSANLLFGTLVLEAMSTTDCRRFINAGSYWEYDSHGRYAPNTLQAATKRAFQDLILYYCRSRGFQALTLTLYDVYGPGDWRCKLIPQLVSALQSGERIRATGGEQGLYFVYIDDVCTGFLHAAREMMAPTPADHRVYALRSDLAVQPKDLVKLLEAVAGRTIDMGWGELPYRDGQIFQPVSSLSRLPGWGAATSLEEGLRRVVAEINAGAA
jgi:nucleoside-diphosphate-sugar epimerase